MYKAKFPLKLSALKGTILAIALVMTNFTHAQTTQTSCQALVQIQNDLWFVKQDGTPLLQLTRDGKNKYSVGLSPDGKTIAYNVFGTENKVALIDATGRFLTTLDPNATDAIVGLDWLTSNILRVAEHLSPDNSTFHFIEIPTSFNSSTSFKQLPIAQGNSCTPSPNHKRTACILGGIYVNGRRIYSPTNPFASATVLQNLSVTGGLTGVTSTEPPFKLDVLEISDNTVGLRVTASDDFFKLQYVSPGGAMSVSLPSDTSADVPAPVYGFAPTIADQKRRIVNIRVLKSKTGYSSLEGELAWDSHGRRITTVEANDLGQRSLILLNRHRSENDNDNSEGQESGAIDGRISLPIDGPIRSVEFTSDTHIRVVGATQVFELNIPAHGPIPAGISYTIAPALPKQLSVKIGTTTATVPVQDWVCR